MWHNRGRYFVSVPIPESTNKGNSSGKTKKDEEDADGNGEMMKKLIMMLAVAVAWTDLAETVVAVQVQRIASYFL